MHKTLKQNKLTKSDFDEFIKLYKAKKRKPTWDEESGDGRWRNYSYDELVARDKTNLDIFWLKDDALEDTEDLPAPEILAQEIVEQLESALEDFRAVEDILAV